MISAHNLCQVYGEYTALDDVSFEIPRGQIVGLVGPNGAGKTTTMKILTGYLAPTEGRASVGGHDVVTDRLAAQRLIGYLPESAPLYRDMLVQDYLLYVARLRGVTARDLRRQLSIAVRACSLEEVLNRPVAHLSKGFRQRVGLAQAMIHDPKVLVLDEPTSGLDPNQILEIREVIRRMGEEKTVILSTHILPEVEATCDRAIIIVSGKVHRDQPLEEFRRGRSVLVRFLGSATGAGEQLAHVGGVEKVTEVAPIAGNPGFRLDSDAREGILAEIGTLAASQGWTLAELTREHHDLEDVFRALGTQEEAA